MGVNQVQEKKKSTKKPRVFKKKVCIDKVNLKVIRKWVSIEIDKLLKDDDIVADYLMELLQVSNEPNIKEIHTQMAEFLGEQESLELCTRLWELLVSAQDDKDGIPQQLIEQEKNGGVYKQSNEQVNNCKRDDEDRSSSLNSGMRSGSRKTNYNRSRSKSPQREQVRDRDRINDGKNILNRDPTTQKTSYRRT